ncbi:MAG TPA: diaminopimelate epimerase, partial [Anaerolineae bacterium]|nr:diaminopimelate epimerase [Anaerolineae bacterium]
MVVIDPATCSIPMTPQNIRQICDRHFGVGADGICYGPLPDAPLPNTMRFFNPDGSEAEKSGNGLRVFARYLWDVGIVTASPFTISINGESLAVRVLDETAQQMAI